MEQEKKRKSYGKEFKLEAIRLIVEEGRSVASVARDLGVNENSLHYWKRQLLNDDKHSFPGHGKLKPEAEELRRLKRELEEVKEERDILKKALGYFSKHGK
jgi:transposase